MEIIRLPRGETAPADTDCIKINEAPMGGFTLVASGLAACDDDDAPESVALVNSEPYPSYDDAEAAGLAWAEELCIAKIYIETGGGSEPVM